MPAVPFSLRHEVVDAEARLTKHQRVRPSEAQTGPGLMTDDSLGQGSGTSRSASRMSG